MSLEKKSILYVYLGGSEEQTSVSKKVITAIKAMNSADIKAVGLFVNPKNNSHLAEERNIMYLRSKKAADLRSRSEIQRINNWIAFTNYYEENKEGFDLIYLRYPLSHPSMLSFVRKFGHKMIIEHNTNEIGELLMMRSGHPFGITPSKFYDWFSFNRLIYRERKLAPKILSHIRLGLANSPETVDYQKQRTPSYNCRLLTNAIDFSNRKPIEFSEINREIRLLVLRGSAQNGLYDGLDRLIKGIASYDGIMEVKLLLVGKSFNEELEMAKRLNVTHLVKHLGELHDEALDAAFEGAHLGVGTLALHRKHMSEASVLRVNHCLSKGLPVMVGYKDVELMNEPRFAPYFCQVPPDDSIIKIDMVVNYAINLYRNYHEVNEDIYNLAKSALSYKERISTLNTYLNYDN